MNENKAMTDNLLKHLNKIKALYEAATEGPWEPAVVAGTETEEGKVAYVMRCIKNAGGVDFWFVSPVGPATVDVCHTGNGPTSRENAGFVAHSRTDVPRMERLIRAQQRVIEALRNASGFYQFPSLGNRIGPVREAESAIAALIEKEWA